MDLKNSIIKVAKFLHITDSVGQLDIVDISFMLMIGKVLIAPGIDYGALGTLIAVILSKMHSDQLESKRPN